MRRASSLGGGRPTSGWRAPIMAHLRRCLLAPPCDVAGPRLSRRSSAPRIWTILGALPRAWVVRLVICASFAASLSLAADVGTAMARGDAKAGKAVYGQRSEER